MLIYLGYKFVEFLVFVTPYPVTYFIADTTATILFFCGKHVNILKKNVSLALDIDINDKKTFNDCLENIYQLVQEYC